MYDVPFWYLPTFPPDVATEVAAKIALFQPLMSQVSQRLYPSPFPRSFLRHQGPARLLLRKISLQQVRAARGIRPAQKPTLCLLDLSKVTVATANVSTVRQILTAELFFFFFSLELRRLACPKAGHWKKAGHREKNFLNLFLRP